MHYLARRHPDISGQTDSNSIVSVDPLNHDPVTGMFLIASKTQLLTVHETVMKKWDLATGNMAKLIRLLPSQLNKAHTISCCSVSDTKKLLLLGTSRGLVAVISVYSGGLVLKCQPKHHHNVVFAGIYKKIIVSIDSRGAIQKYAGFKNSFYGGHGALAANDILMRSKLIQLPMHKIRKTISHCTIARVHSGFGILIIASDTGLLRFFCLTNDKIILEQDSLEDEVTSLLLKEEECRMFTSDKSGNICCWELPTQYPARKLFFAHCLWRVENLDAQNQPLSTFCVQTFGDFVVTGDAKGFVKVWKVKVRIMTPAKRRRASIVDEMRLFKLTELGLQDYECKLVVTFPASKDWLHHLLLITDKDLEGTRGRHHLLMEDADDGNDDEEQSTNDSAESVLCLISASLDGELFAWKMTGSCLGELTVNSRRSRRPWKVRIDLDEMEKTRLKHAAKLFLKFEL